MNLNLGTKQDCKLTPVAGSPIISNPRDGTEIDRSVKTVKTLRICVCVRVCMYVDKQGVMGPMTSQVFLFLVHPSPFPNAGLQPLPMGIHISQGS